MLVKIFGSVNVLFVSVNNDLLKTESLQVVKELALIINCGSGCIVNCYLCGTLHCTYVYAELLVKIRIIGNGRICAVKLISVYNIINYLLERIDRSCVELLFNKGIEAV